MRHDNLFPSLKGQGAIAIDLETYDPELTTRGSGAHRDGFIAGVAIGTEKGFRRYYPIGHEAKNPGDKNLDKKKVLGWLKQELATNVPKIGANLGYDLSFLNEAGIDVKGPLYDIQIAEPLLDEQRFQYGLEYLARDYLGEHKAADEMDAWLIERFGKKQARNNIWRAPIKMVTTYAIGDVDLPIRIFKKQKEKLEKQGLWDLFLMESKLIPMLVAMKRRGVRVNLGGAKKLKRKLQDDQSGLERLIKKATGVQLEPWKASSLAAIFDALGLEYPVTPKTKKPSFRSDFLEHHESDIAHKIREVRQLDKLRETFLQNAIIDSAYNGRIHCNFNQLKSDEGGTVTGRFSSSKPNLQQVPTRTEVGKMLRKLFLPDAGCDWGKLDFSQIEFRLMVNEAANLKLKGCDDFVNRFRNDPTTDFHKVVASITGLDRSSAKSVTFGLAYGEGLKKLARSLGVSEDAGQAMINQYFAHVPFMRSLSERKKGLAGSTGKVTTLMGRHIRFNRWMRRKSDGTVEVFQKYIPGTSRAFIHKGLNAFTQGSAADVNKKAMVDIWESGVCDVLGAPHLTVHDEMDFSVPKTKLGKEAFAETKHIMENCVKLNIPLKVDGGLGPNWGSIE